MKILYIITQADGGGAQKYTLALATHFWGSIAAGTEAKHLFTTAKERNIKTFELKHLKRNINLFHDFLAIFEIRKLIKNLEPDIVHLNSSKAGFLGSFAARGLKTKTVFTAHGFIFNEPLSLPLKKIYLLLEKFASRYRDFIICVSKADELSAKKYNLISPNKITTIYNGLDNINFLDKAEARTKLALPNSKIIIGCTSNFYKSKGLDVLIEAIAQLDKNLLNKILVVLVGSGPEFESLKLKVESKKLINQFKFLGNIDNVKIYLRAFDVFVLPSRKEGFPFGLLEAMQAGLPIVASNTGGTSEALGDAGFLVRPENQEGLCTTLTKIISDLNTHGPAYFNELGQKARARAKNFNSENMLIETEKIYSSVMNK